MTATKHDHGITPAYAGKRKSDNNARGHNRDHPRVCGEKTGKNPGDTYYMGSPPRMRGKVCCLYELVWHSGITPAYAGKSHKKGEKELVA